MAEVKGSLLVDVVRLIRANKDRDWKKYLNEKDLEIIESQILPTAWYPLDTYERAERAIFQEIGQGKLENARIWGRFAIDDMVKRIYQNLIEEQDPMLTLERFTLFRKQLFRFQDPNFQPMEFSQMGPKQVRIKIQLNHPLELFEAYAYQSMGSFERLVELAGGKEPKVSIVEYDWKSRCPYAVLEVSWK